MLPLSVVFLSLLFQAAVSQTSGKSSQSEKLTANSYARLLESESIEEQREAIKAILVNPEKYTSLVQQDLREYPHLLKTNPVAAKRAVYVSAILRNPSFGDILAKYLGDASTEDECLYDCPLIFALAVQARFGSWKLPQNLDSEATAVEDLKATIKRLSDVSLKTGSIEDQMQGPWVEARKKEIEGKTEEELIVLAGPKTASRDMRQLAISRLATVVAGSKNRLEFYLLALNDFQDGSSEYRSALYQTIYRAEVAKARGL